MPVASHLAAYYEMSPADFDRYTSLVRAMSPAEKVAAVIPDERNILAVSGEECAA